MEAYRIKRFTQIARKKMAYLCPLYLKVEQARDPRSDADPTLMLPVFIITITVMLGLLFLLH